MLFRSILSGSTKSPRGNSLSPLANYFSVTISQLIGDDPLSPDRVPGTYNPSIVGWTSVPLISWSDAVEWPSIWSKLRETGWKDWTSTDARISPNTFALKVKGESMAPRFAENTLLIIDPAREAKDKDFVVVLSKNATQANFTQLFYDGDSAYLRPLNRDFEPDGKMKLMGRDQKILGVLIQARSDMVDIYSPVKNDQEEHKLEELEEELKHS